MNGDSATLARTVREGDVIEVFPHEAGASPFEEPLASHWERMRNDLSVALERPVTHMS